MATALPVITKLILMLLIIPIRKALSAKPITAIITTTISQQQEQEQQRVGNYLCQLSSVLFTSRFLWKRSCRTRGFIVLDPRGRSSVIIIQSDVVFSILWVRLVSVLPLLLSLMGILLLKKKNHNGVAKCYFTRYFLKF